MSRATVEAASLRTRETPLEPEDVGPTLDQIHARFIANNGLQGRERERIVGGTELEGYVYDGTKGAQLTTLQMTGYLNGDHFILRTLHLLQDDKTTKPMFEFAQPSRMRLLRDSLEALAEIDKVNLPPPADPPSQHVQPENPPKDMDDLKS